MVNFEAIAPNVRFADVCDALERARELLDHARTHLAVAGADKTRKNLTENLIPILDHLNNDKTLSKHSSLRLGTASTSAE